MTSIFGGVEAGGTKFVWVVGRDSDDVREEIRVATTTPYETIAAFLAFFAAHRPISALGIASFGPVDLAEGSPSWGFITKTPKPGWSRVDLAGAFRRGLGVP